MTSDGCGDYQLVDWTVLPYFSKRKQVRKVTFLVREQDMYMYVISTDDVNGIYHDVLSTCTV